MNVPSIRVLIVDDDRAFREAACAILTSLTHVDVVGSVESGAEAIAALPALQPDVVLMDMEMPGMTGIEATREIKRAHPLVRVAIVTGHDWSWARDAALGVNADGFVSKASFPMSSRVLFAGWVGLLAGYTNTLAA